MQRTPPKQTPADGAVSTPLVITKDTPVPRSKRQRPNNTPPSPPSPSALNSDKHDEFMEMLTKVLSEITEIRKSNLEMQKSIEFYINKYDELNGRILTLETEKSNSELHIVNLEHRLDEMERQARSACLEIRGVPSKSHETKQDLCDVVDKIQSKIKIEVQPNAIKDIYRIRGKSNEERPVVVDFATTIIKANILKAIKKYNASNTTNRLNVGMLGFEHKNTPVFVSEFLTPKAKRLYFLARDAAKTYNYNFCWTSNGRIFLRRSEGSPPLLISSEKQLENLKQKN